jgi:uncharacterized protein YbjT (DUF2867 family)
VPAAAPRRALAAPGGAQRGVARAACGAAPGASVVQADLYDGRDVAALLDGVAVMLHIGPSYHPHEAEIGYLMVDAAVREARRGAFKHFVLSSVLNSQLRKMMNHDCKRYVEEYVVQVEGHRGGGPAD